MKVFCQNKRFNRNKIMQFSSVLSPLWFFPDAMPVFGNICQQKPAIALFFWDQKSGFKLSI
jgi:hypothetical protein